MFVNFIFLQTATKHIIIGIATGIGIFLFLGVLIVSFVLEYRKRQRRHAEELVLAKINFDKEVLISNLETQEQTFTTISQEIHDNVGQILSLTKVQLNIIDQDEKVNTAMLGDAKENISKAMADLRDIAKSLSGDRIKNLGLMKALEQEQQRINRSGILEIMLNITGEVQAIPVSKEIILFRVIQEGIQNTIKHAEATQLYINVDYLLSEFRITILDNGKGFDLKNEHAPDEGLGLKNMTARIALIGGRIAIERGITAGTSILITIPYEK